uniref:protein-glutamine gamma-glutamyltransferase n=1 Tax=Gouania willdenowi TaxID=441366 RepID=A0A8C5H421_GOUWI
EPFDGVPETEVEPRTYGQDQGRKTNKHHHHTHEYDTSNLVIRRGQEFVITITFNRLPTQYDDYQLEFLIGPSLTSQITIPLGSRASTNSYTWNGKILEQNMNSIMVEVLPKPTALVGRYRVYVAISTGNGMKRTKRNASTDLYLLFNAWCQQDAVYLADQDERKEYVLNDYGVMYQGSYGFISQRHWIYGQFEEGILNACIFILDASKMPISDRGKVIKVVRKGSAMINSQDDDGVLVGNWSDDYSMGTAPTAWTGSIKILLQYANTRIPVCYAQCWVFAGVFNTFLRCLGIPARVISNFNSAHDNTGNLKTDLIFKPDGTPDRRRTKDSIWNYHCWNEVFIKRDDIADRYGGWQVVDSTPQELSSGYYCCGPASVVAVKEGEVCYPYDTGFVFAEVNSDVVFFKRDKYGEMKVFRIDTTHVGKRILTKAVGSIQAVDVTHNYKYREGTPQDMATMERAEKFGCERDHSVTPVFNVTVRIDAEPVTNTFLLSHRWPTRLDSTVSVVFYTGVIDSHFKDENFSVTVPPKQQRSVPLKVTSQEYFPHLGSALSLELTVIAKYQDETINDIKVISLVPPELQMEYLFVGHKDIVKVKFTNPFQFPLKNVFLYIEGAGITPLKHRFYQEIPSLGEITWTEEILPRLPGERYILSLLYCSAIAHVWGFSKLMVH